MYICSDPLSERIIDLSHVYATIASYVPRSDIQDV